MNKRKCLFFSLSLLPSAPKSVGKRLERECADTRDRLPRSAWLLAAKKDLPARVGSAPRKPLQPDGSGALGKPTTRRRFPEQVLSYFPDSGGRDWVARRQGEAEKKGGREWTRCPLLGGGEVVMGGGWCPVGICYSLEEKKQAWM